MLLILSYENFQWMKGNFDALFAAVAADYRLPQQSLHAKL